MYLLQVTSLEDQSQNAVSPSRFSALQNALSGLRGSLTSVTSRISSLEQSQRQQVRPVCRLGCLRSFHRFCILQLGQGYAQEYGKAWEGLNTGGFGFPLLSELVLQASCR